MPDIDLNNEQWSLFVKLAETPFADAVELAFLSDIYTSDVYAHVKRLIKLKLVDSVPHGTASTRTSSRYFLTRKGVRLYLRRALIQIEETPFPITREWYQSLLRRLDSVRTVYRLARSFVPADLNTRHRTPQIIWYRKGNWDAALRFYDGTVLPIMIQGRNWGMPLFNRKLQMTNEYDEKHIGGLLIVTPDYYSANKALTTLRKVNSKLPAFACEESRIGDAKSGDEIWLTLDLERADVSAQDIYRELNKGRFLLPRKLAKRANHPWVKMPENLLLWSNLKGRDKRYLNLIAKFYFPREEHLRRIDGVKQLTHRDIIQRLKSAGLIERLKLDGKTAWP